MNDTGQDLRAIFRAASGDMPPDIDLLRGVRDRRAAGRRRARHRARALVSAGAVAAVGGAAALAAVLAASVGEAPSALAAVTSALEKTSAESYRFSLDSAADISGHTRGSSRMAGAFDPRHRLGEESLVRSSLRDNGQPVHAQIRFIGGSVYAWMSPGSGFGTPGKPWDKSPIPPPGADALPGQDLSGFSGWRPVSPAALLGVLRSAATVRDEGPAAGPGWTGTKYGFTACPSVLGQLRCVTGTVYVDSQGLVRRLVTVATLRAAHSRSVLMTSTADLTFGDFGTPVSVSAPPAGQVADTSTPDWMLLF